ncbi:MAG: formylglycine-generating enzyme family protein, partial [Gammaproteobacteria bacterium]
MNQQDLVPSSQPETAAGERPFVHDLGREELLALQQAAAARHGVPVHFRDPFRDNSGQGPELAVIPAGSFEMGSDEHEFGHRREEAPRHYVTLSRDFALGRYTITARQFEQFRAETGWYLRPDLIWARDDYPVINIRIRDAELFAQWLSEKTGQRYRLPTEAEWEYACRAGSLAPFAFGDNVSCREVHFNAAFPYVEAREKRRWFLPRCSPLMKALPVGSLP